MQNSQRLAAAALFLLPLPALAQLPTSPAVEQCIKHATGDHDISDSNAWQRKKDVWLKSCEQAIKDAPDNADVQLGYAGILSSNGDKDQAIILLRKAAAKDSPQAHRALYERYRSFEQGKPNPAITRAEAEQHFRRAAELNESDAAMMLAIRLDRGDTLKRDKADAIYWAERTLKNPPKDKNLGSLQTLYARLLVKSDKPEERARGIELLERLVQVGRLDARVYLGHAVRAADPVRARKLFEEAMRGNPGGAAPPLSEMLRKGEGGPVDTRRAVKVLDGMPDVPGVSLARGRLMLEGKLLPYDLNKALDLIRHDAGWEHESRMELFEIMAKHPDARVVSGHLMMFDATQAAELGEPGAVQSLIAIKLSANKQFGDKAGGCALVEKYAAAGDDYAKSRLPECKAN